MKIKLTESAVEKASCPKGQQALLWDTETKGFGLLVSGSSNTKSFVVRGAVNGRQTRLKVCDAGLGLKRARELAKDMMMKFYRGVDPKAKTAENVTLQDALDLYLKKRVRLRPKSRDNYERTITNYFPDWLKMPVSRITKNMVEHRFHEISDEVEARDRERNREYAERWDRRGVPEKAAAARARAPRKGQVAANAAVKILRAVLNIFDDMPNPMKLKKTDLHKQRPRTRHLKDDQAAAFWAAVQALENTVARDYIVLLMFSGMRATEAACLKWTYINFEERSMTLPPEICKSDEPLALPLVDVVMDMLIARQRVGRDASGFVFPGHSEEGRLTSSKSFFAKIEAETGIKLSAHDLRRTFITACEDAEISEFAQRKLVSHAADDVHGAYKMTSVERLRGPAQRVADRIKGLVRYSVAAGANVETLKRVADSGAR